MAVVFAVMHSYNIFDFLLLLSILFLKIFCFKSGIDKSMENSTIPACPSRMCLFNRGNTEETNSSKMYCLMFAYFFVLCGFVSKLILWFLDNLWFDDLGAE